MFRRAADEIICSWTWISVRRCESDKCRAGCHCRNQKGQRRSQRFAERNSCHQVDRDRERIEGGTPQSRQQTTEARSRLWTRLALECPPSCNPRLEHRPSMERKLGKSSKPC